VTVGEDTARDLAGLRAGLSETTEGLCVAVSWSDRLVTVNLGGAEQVMPWAGSPPWVGERVRVVYVGQKPLCIAVLGSPMGTVQSVSGSKATVLGDDGVTYVYPYAFGDTLASGNIVRLDHAGHFVAARYATTQTAPIFDVPDAPPSAAKSATFRPIDSGNYRNGVFSSQFVEISTTRTGVLWYGSQIANTIPDSAVITRAEIQLVELWDEVPGTGTSNVSGSGAVSLLGTYADNLKTGAAFGIGFRKNFGWRRFDTYANSGAIYMEWS